jgi:hypothetical protein
LGAASGYQTKGLRKRSLLTAAPAALAVAITIVVPWQLRDTCLLNRQIKKKKNFHFNKKIKIKKYLYIYVYSLKICYFPSQFFLLIFLKKIQHF